MDNFAKNAARYVWYRDALISILGGDITAEKIDNDIDLGMRVFEALNVAHRENGYSFKNMDARKIAEDLVLFCSDLEEKDPSDLVVAVQLWMNKNLK